MDKKLRLTGSRSQAHKLACPIKGIREICRGAYLWYPIVPGVSIPEEVWSRPDVYEYEIQCPLVRLVG